MKRLRTVPARLFSVLLLVVVALCVVAAFRFVNFESAATLLLFDSFFVLLMFELKGTLNRKLGVLAAGNLVGLFWSLIFCSIAMDGGRFFGETFNCLFAVFRPFLNFLWVITFWSLSLSAFPKPERAQAEAKN